MLEPTLLGQWLVVQRHQLLRFLAQTGEAHPAQVKFILPLPPFSFPSTSSSSKGANANVEARGGADGLRSQYQPQHIFLVKHQIRSMSLSCIISSNSASSFLRQSSGAKFDEKERGSGSLLLRSQREMRRFVIIHKMLFAGVVEPEAIIIRLPEDALCAMRTVRHYRQRLLDATLLQMLCEHLSVHNNG
jgi:hypothetical protein